MTDDLQNWWLVMFLENDDNRWALFNTRQSAEYFYNRLAGTGMHRMIFSESPRKVTARLQALTA